MLQVKVKYQNNYRGINFWCYLSSLLYFTVSVLIYIVPLAALTLKERTFTISEPPANILKASVTFPLQIAIQT